LATEVSICSNSLLLLGAQTITSLTDGTTYASLCNQFYAETRDDLLRKHHWKFATARATLAQDALYSASWEWSYGYTLPTDCLKIRSTSEDPDPWDREGDWIVSDNSSLSIKYTKRITDTAKFDASFIVALQVDLAMKLCKPVTGSLDLMKTLAGMSEMAIKDARTQSAFEATDITTPDDILADYR